MPIWDSVTIGSCLEPLHLPAEKVQAKDYLTEGTFPIVDQGQTLIAGWTNNSAGLIEEHIPVVVFGDHTRAIKFIDFPFVRGADGTQILHPDNRFNVSFFYFACKSVEIEGRGYNRHFSILKEMEIPIPPKDEQEKIGSVLTLIESLIKAEDHAGNAATALKRAAMRELFTRGLRGEPQKETEIGLVPESWGQKELLEMAIVQTGIAKGRKFADTEMVDLPYLRVANVQDGHLDLSEMKNIRIRKTEIDRYRLQPDDIVLTEGGDFDKLGRGFIWRGQIQDCVHQNHVFAVRTNKNILEPAFFAYLAQSDYGKAYFLKVAHKTTNLACINTQKLKAFPVIFPSLPEQAEIVEILDAIDRKIDLHKRKKALLEELFKSLLHKLMTGEIRVEDLDVAALEGAE